MTQGDLDEISLAIGALQADVRMAERTRLEILARLIEMNDKLSALPLLDRRVAQLEPEVAAWADARRKFAGAIMVLALAAGFAGFIGGVVKAVLFDK